MDNNMTPVPLKKDGPVTMNFFDALKQISVGKIISRISWNNTDYCLLKNGWLTIYTKNSFHSWLVSDGDIDGNDWIVLKELN